RLQVGYAFTRATVERFSADPTLEGNDVPQVPRHLVSFGARYANPRILDVAVQGRISSAQFEDDQNELPLAGYFTLDLQASRRLGPRLEAFAAFETVPGPRYPVGRPPTLPRGPPVLGRAGLRLEWGR